MPFQQLFDAATLRQLMAARGAAAVPATGVMLDELAGTAAQLARAMQEVRGAAGDPELFAAGIRGRLASLISLPELGGRGRDDERLQDIADRIVAGLDDDPARWGTLIAWAITLGLGRNYHPAVDERAGAELSRTWVDEWKLGKIIVSSLQELAVPEPEAQGAVVTIKVLLAAHLWYQQAARDDAAYRLLTHLLAQPEARAMLGINRYHGVLWFNQESFSELLWWLLTLAAVETTADTTAPAEQLVAAYQLIEQLRRAEQVSECRIDRLLDAISESTVDSRQS